MSPEIPATLRWLALDGPVNFRDLGGYRTTDGREVRHGRVFRADSLHTMSTDDVRRVTSEHGVGVVVDLRTAAEVDLIGVGPIRDAVGAWHNVSIFDETQRSREHTSAPTTMADEYVAMLQRTSTHFVRVLDIMATTTTPAVFHCAAGKDRTGLIAALLLHLLGVSDEEIAADYALTQHVMPTLQQRFIDRVTNPRFAPLYGDRSEWEPRMNRAMESKPETMLSVMKALADRYGSAHHWLLEAGLPVDRVETLRAHLLH